MPEPCPECAVLKCVNCTVQVLNQDDEWVPCPCYEAGHLPAEEG